MRKLKISLKALFSKENMKNFVFSYVLTGWFFLLAFFLIIEFTCTFLRDPIYELKIPVYIRGLILTILVFFSFDTLRQLFSKKLSRIFTFIVTFIFSFLLVSSIAVFIEFGDFLSLSKIKFFVFNPNYQTAYIREYLFNWNIIFFIALWALVHFLFKLKFKQFQKRSKRTNYIILVISAICISLLTGNLTHHAKYKRLDMTSSFITAVNKLRLGQQPGLHQPNRMPLENYTMKDTFNIIFIINESFGKKAFSLYDPDCPMTNFHAWLSENSEQCFYFERAFTNASATDISVTSILTGSAPYESSDKIHSMPLMWEWWRKAGMRTAMVSAQFYQWANFPVFFTPAPDYFFTGETIKGKIYNDGIDELAAMKKFRETVHLLSENQPFAAIYNSNSLHFPFQQESGLMAYKPNYSSKYYNAATVLDEGYKRLFNLLKMKNLMDNTIIVFTADHGETDKPQHESSHRLFSFFDEIQNIPMLIYLPKKITDKHPEYVENLKKNKNRIVSNLDLMPTFVDLCGGNRNEKNAEIYAKYKGYSLVKEIPEDRISISLNTNELREWELEGFGIYFGDKRFVYTDFEREQFFDILKDPNQTINLWERIDNYDRKRVDSVINSNFFLKKIYFKE